MNRNILQSYISAIPKPFSATHLPLSKFYTTLSNSLQTALRVLDFITSQTTKTQTNHLNLIQACMHDLEETNTSPVPSNSTPNVFVDMLDRDVSWSYLFFEMHKEGVRADAMSLSSALSSCGLKNGVQLHCLAIKTGFHSYVYVGSSLIDLYGKCSKLVEAYRVFEEMPERNVVSWTTIISSFAQHWEVEMCLELYHRLRVSTLRPNDFTFTTILSACTVSGFLEEGKNVHCQTIKMGFNSYTHIGNALISMYSKCGNVMDALYIFVKIRRRDLISWNSMIAGYAQYGFAAESINLFDEMRRRRIQPDSITFLGVLSSCRHAGLVGHGLACFNAMIKYGVEPELDHYSCIIDLLGRSGRLVEAKEFIEKMPVCPNAVIWGSLLSSCRLHGNVWIGIQAAENRLMLDPGCAATHVQLVNLYASAGYWDQAARVRKLMKDRGLKTNPGYSWIEIRKEVYRFRAEDRSNVRVSEILSVVDNLYDNMRSLIFVPELHESVICNQWQCNIV